MPYEIILGRGLPARAEHYATALRSGRVRPGQKLATQLTSLVGPPDATSVLQALLQTKSPQIFAESAVAGDGSDWNALELSLLGDISIAAEVEFFDDGEHRNPTPHVPPIQGTLVFTCGALLASQGVPTPDLAEVAPQGQLDESAYHALYARRLLPVLDFIQRSAVKRQRDAVVTIPGLGCGQFAGHFAGRLGPKLEKALRQILRESAPSTHRLRLLRFDPFDECADAADTFGNSMFRVRPLRKSAHPRPQLCAPVDYQEPGDDFRGCDIYSLVAWDQVSWRETIFSSVRAPPMTE